MHKVAQAVKADVARALEALRVEVANGVTLEVLGERFGVSHSTVSRWLDGNREPTGENRSAVLAWYARGHGPRDTSRDYERGVLYACEAMSETIARLLREQREHHDRALAEKAAALIPPVAGRGAPDQETGARRRRAK